MAVNIETLAGADLDAVFFARGAATARADTGICYVDGGVDIDIAQRYRASDGTGTDIAPADTGHVIIIGGVETDIRQIFRWLHAITLTLFGGGTTVTEGESANFYVTVEGTGLHYEWRKDGTPISGAPDSYNYSFFTTMGSAGTYSCRIYNAFNSVTSGNQTLTVEAYVEPPSISSTSGAGTYTVGATISLSVSATGDSLNYEWMKNGSPISGAPNSSSYSFTAATGGSGSYSVRVYNSANSVESGGISVVVTSASAAPTITSFTVSPTTQYRLESVTVSISASDSNGDMTTLEVGFYKNEASMEWVTIYNGSVPNASSFSTSWTFEIPGDTSILYGGKFTAYVADGAGHSDATTYDIGIMV